MAPDPADGFYVATQLVNQSFTESLRGINRLRQAFNTLYEIVEAEKKYLKKYPPNSHTSLSLAASLQSKSSESSSDAMSPANTDRTRDIDQDLSAHPDKKLHTDKDGASSSASGSHAPEDQADFRTVTDNSVRPRPALPRDETFHNSDRVPDRPVHTLGDSVMLWSIASVTIHGSSRRL